MVIDRGCTHPRRHGDRRGRRAPTRARFHRTDSGVTLITREMLRKLA
ncbi:MAG: hypothetical protein MZW92_54105 [Comamonadaceae bacterium]|nr:hypothetical protein [Comamonadaceae bacterium]